MSPPLATVHGGQLTRVALARLRVDLGTQQRVRVDEAAVEDYCDAMAEGWPDTMPPVIVATTDEGLAVVDGIHRTLAAKRLAFEMVPAVMVSIGLDEAIWASCAVNTDHGLRRSAEDKRRAIRTALRHRRGATLSDRAIAAHVGVSPTIVGNVRRELEAEGTIEQVTVRQDQRGRRMETAAIGSTAPAPGTTTATPDEGPSLERAEQVSEPPWPAYDDEGGDDEGDSGLDVDAPDDDCDDDDVPPWAAEPREPMTPEQVAEASAPAVQVEPVRPAFAKSTTSASAVNLWRTPRGLVTAAGILLGLDGPPVLDIAAQAASAVADDWFGPDHPDRHRRDALAQPSGAWLSADGWAWLNPPYSDYCADCRGAKWGEAHADAGHRRVTISQWMERAQREGAERAHAHPLVALPPVRTDTRWWHQSVQGRGGQFSQRAAAQLVFVEGRIAFEERIAGEWIPRTMTNFASAIVVYRTTPLGQRWQPGIGWLRATGERDDPWATWDGFAPMGRLVPA